MVAQPQCLLISFDLPHSLSLSTIDGRESDLPRSLRATAC